MSNMSDVNSSAESRAASRNASPPGGNSPHSSGPISGECSPHENSHFFQEDRLTLHEFYRKHFPHNVFIQSFGPGEAFGEIALTSGGVRTGTMVCREDSLLLTLDKASYTYIIGRFKSEQDQQQLEFLKQFLFFQNIPSSNFLSLQKFTTTLNLGNRCTVYDEGDHSNGVFFIKQGEVEISRNFTFDLSKPSEENLFKNTQKVYQRRVGLKVIGAGNFFGEYEMLEKLDKRVFRAQVVQPNTELLYIRKDNLLNFLVPFQGIKQFTNECLIKNRKIEEYAEFMYNDIRKKLLKSENSEG